MNPEKYCLIRQPAGLGDIFFCQKIAKKLMEKGWYIIWPVIDKFYYIKDYIKGYISFPLITDSFKFKKYYNCPDMLLENRFLFIPLQDADKIYPYYGLMESKYKLVNLSYDNWENYFKFDRNLEREEKLYNYLGLKQNEKYNVINCNYGSPPDMLKIKNIKCTNGFKNIELNSVGFDNIFDWCKVLENAEEIHTVETAWCYIIEKLEIKNKPFMYMRGNRHNFDYIKGVFKKDWNYIK